MTQDLYQIWRRHAATMPYFPSAAISDAGLMLGAGTVLARMRTSESGRTILDRDADHDRLFALLEIGAVEDLKFLFQNLDNIDIFHFAPVTPVVPKRPRKSLFLWGDGENGLGQTDDGRCLAAAEHRFVGAHRCAN